ncbi:hypothetical protein ACN9MU_15210 [Pseudoduganella sp. R-32]|uniref:hypothetical protein n=1 Tax=Pseudoduganella sp. R-32 TaxID=3404061 RepID=UPI003CF4A399
MIKFVGTNAVPKLDHGRAWLMRPDGAGKTLTRQVIGEFADRHPRQKARRCHAAGNQRWLDAYPHSADVPIEPIELTVDNWLDIKAHAALFRLDFMDFLRPRIWSANGLFPTLQRPVSERSLLKFRP